MARFTLGRVVMTSGFAALASEEEQSHLAAASLLNRHASGDWGELGAGDKKANEDALKHGDRILSKYTVAGEAVYVITEADRSSTTVLLASDYRSRKIQA